MHSHAGRDRHKYVCLDYSQHRGVFERGGESKKWVISNTMKKVSKKGVIFTPFLGGTPPRS